MFQRSTRIALGILLAVLFLGTLAAYPHLPDPMISHWNAAGEPDDTMPRFWAAWLIPLLSLALVGLFAILPRIDPKGEHYAAFRQGYERFVVFFLAFMLLVQGLSLAWNLGYPISLERVLPLAIAALFLFTADLIARAKPNWFVGIRTPWTLTSPTVWEQTHRVGAKVFALMALLWIFVAVYPPLLWFAIPAILLSALGLVVYSYALYSQEQTK